MSSFPGFVSVALERLESCLHATPGLTGYCLITNNGQVCNPAKGPLVDDLQASAADPTRITSTAAAAAPPPAVVSQFLRPFNTLQPTVSFSALGTKLQVVHQAEGAVFALGPRRRVGLGVCLVPQVGAMGGVDLRPDAAAAGRGRRGGALRCGHPGGLCGGVSSHRFLHLLTKAGSFGPTAVLALPGGRTHSARRVGLSGLVHDRPEG
eukprot:XP_001689892.1 predicted protein [Chlamydomonas reinhardtii]